MTVHHQETFTVTDRGGVERPLSFGVENGAVICQGPKSWQTDECNATTIAAGLLLVIEAAAREQREQRES